MTDLFLLVAFAVAPLGRADLAATSVLFRVSHEIDFPVLDDSLCRHCGRWNSA